MRMRIRHCDARTGVPMFYHSLEVIHTISGQRLDDAVAANADEGWVDLQVMTAGRFDTERVDCDIKIRFIDEAREAECRDNPKSPCDLYAGVFHDEDLSSRDLESLLAYRESGPSLIKKSEPSILSDAVLGVDDLHLPITKIDRGNTFIDRGMAFDAGSIKSLNRSLSEYRWLEIDDGTRHDVQPSDSVRVNFKMDPGMAGHDISATTRLQASRVSSG